MKRTDFEREIMQKTLETLLGISQSKGQEYSRGDDNANSNFVRLAKDLDMTPEEILWVYASKHIDSVVCFIKDTAKGNVRKLSEPIEGRIDDVIMYMLLLKGLIRDRKEGVFDVTDSDLPPLGPGVTKEVAPYYSGHSDSGGHWTGTLPEGESGGVGARVPVSRATYSVAKKLYDRLTVGDGA